MTTSSSNALRPRRSAGLAAPAALALIALALPAAPLAAQPSEPVEVVRPAAEALELVAGEGYEVSQETQDGSLLIVVVKDKTQDEEGH